MFFTNFHSSRLLSVIIAIAGSLFLGLGILGAINTSPTVVTPVPADLPEVPCLAKQPDCHQMFTSVVTDSILREALLGEAWITGPTLGSEPPNEFDVKQTDILLTEPISVNSNFPPPSNLVASISGLFFISASWDAPDEPELVNYYAYGIGSEPGLADVKWWQSTSRNTQAYAHWALTEGQVYYVSVCAVSHENLRSDTISSGPLTATHQMLGEPSNQITYTIAPYGFDANGNITNTWTITHATQISSFLDLMFPILYDLYGPPSISYTVGLIRDLRQVSSAIFYPSTGNIHLGDTATYQLITHELVHTWRNQRILSSNSVWQYNPKYDGFEEGFAQAVSYDAMTEFARRHPDFGLSQKIYQSSKEWDYDFQNVPALQNVTFWSDSGGMGLSWIRYEMAAAAMSKIEIEHPGFYKAFNTEYYSRLNANPYLTVTRPLIVDIIQTVAPTIEGKPASDWVDQQHIFACELSIGYKIWIYLQHYPSSNQYLIFNRIFFHETFPNGSDWAYWNGTSWSYHNLNGSEGEGTFTSYNGDTIWSRSLLITPTLNPPDWYGFGRDIVNITTGSTYLPWPGGDASQYITNVTTLGLYTLDTQFVTGTTVITNSVYRVMGEELRNTRGVFGGIVGGNGGQIFLNHRDYPNEVGLSVLNGAFWGERSWASISNPTTNSGDSIPGIIDVLYVDATGNTYTDTRTINYGSWGGNQLFLFDVAEMHPANIPIPVVKYLYLPLVLR